jgi:hypothetical protein
VRNGSGHTGLSDHQFQSIWLECDGNAAKVAKVTGISYRNVLARRNRVEKNLGAQLPSSGLGGGKGRGDNGANPYNYNPRTSIEGFTGRAVIFSDAHWWAGISDTPAYRGLLEVIKQEKPGLVIANGDILDGSKVSRFPPDGWDRRPRMSDELDEVKERMAEIRAAYRGARHIRTLGNHDSRFDRWLAVNAGEFEGIQGFRLSDHLPEWEECISLFVNGHTVVKHRFNGGQHAAFNNTLRAGTNIFTGHTHRLGVTAWGDYNGRRYGCETGSLAEIGGPQFAYAEDNPSPGCSGFAVATFDKEGRLLYPELAESIGGVCYFRGKRIASIRRKIAA